MKERRVRPPRGSTAPQLKRAAMLNRRMQAPGRRSEQPRRRALVDQVPVTHLRTNLALAPTTGKTMICPGACAAARRRAVARSAALDLAPADRGDSFRIGLQAVGGAFRRAHSHTSQRSSSAHRGSGPGFRVAHAYIMRSSAGNLVRNLDGYFPHHVFFVQTKRDDGRQCCNQCGAAGCRDYVKRFARELGIPAG